MKTKQIKGAVDILLVNIEAKEIQPISFLRKENGDHYLIFTDGDFERLPAGNWNFHCRVSKLTEEQAEDLVPFYPISPGSNFVGHPVYTRKEALTNRATESFQSLLEANGVLKENPYGPGDNFSRPWGYLKYWPAWQKAEANVFHPETTLIFIKTQ